MSYKKHFTLLKKKFEAGTLAHAYIFSGRDIVEITKFYADFLESIGCTFPDVMMVRSGETQETGIGQIREVQQFLSYKPFHGNLKTVVIEQAERMSVQAQNCLLKNLEEPKGNALIILVSAKPEMLLQTIISRCQQLTFLGGEKFTPDAKGQKALEHLLNVTRSSLAEKFGFAKTADLEGDNLKKILGLLRWHFRDAMLADLKSEKAKKTVKLIEQISYQTEFSNANPKLALEILL